MEGRVVQGVSGLEEKTFGHLELKFLDFTKLLQSTLMQTISPSVGCSCKMDTRLHFKARSFVGFNYNWPTHEKICMPSCDA
jgi:hypothetical protein